MSEVSNTKMHEAFLKSDRRHILMITNHGIHQWGVIPGLPDTGGQNIYVNQLTEVLAQFGFKVTIANRGGYPHPVTGEMRRGIHYKDENQRILFLEDGIGEFIRKEDMNPLTLKLAECLKEYLDEEGLSVELMISHYWDAAKVGVLLNRSLSERVIHVWVPHSLGKIKKRNMPPDSREDLRIDERIETEKELMQELDFTAATSATIRRSLSEEYGHKNILFLPPCIQVERYYPRNIEQDHEIWSFLSRNTGLSREEIQKCKIVTEISRTDATKRKDILIKAFSEVRKKHKDVILIVSIDQTEEELSGNLLNLIKELGQESYIAVIGYEWERLPLIYAVTSIYCSPSVMEGFGMAVQEAAATAVPVVGSHLIPFVSEYLLGENVREAYCDEMETEPLKVGEGAIMVQADDINGFKEALLMLLEDEQLRKEMGNRAYKITVPYFTWKEMVKRLFNEIGITI